MFFDHVVSELQGRDRDVPLDAVLEKEITVAVND
jgi:hypothetical protein